MYIETDKKKGVSDSKGEELVVKPLPVSDIDDVKELQNVNYCNSNKGCLVLSYAEIHGLLMLEKYNFNLWTKEDQIKNNFHLFPPSLNDIKEVNICSNQQLISCLSPTVS